VEKEWKGDGMKFLGLKKSPSYVCKQFYYP